MVQPLGDGSSLTFSDHFRTDVSSVFSRETSHTNSLVTSLRINFSKQQFQQNRNLEKIENWELEIGIAGEGNWNGIADWKSQKSQKGNRRNEIEERKLQTSRGNWDRGYKICKIKTREYTGIKSKHVELRIFFQILELRIFF